MAVTVVKYKKCVVAVNPHGDVSFVNHNGRVTTVNGVENIRATPIEEVLGEDYELGGSDMNEDFNKSTVYLCTIVFTYSSDFNGESTEHDCTYDFEDIAEIKTV